MKPILIFLFLIILTCLLVINCSAQTGTPELARATGLWKWNDTAGISTGHTPVLYDRSKIVYSYSIYGSDLNIQAAIIYYPLTKKTSDTIQLFYPALKFIRVGKYLYKIDSNRIIHINKP